MSRRRDTKIDREIGDRIRSLRIAQHMSQTALGNAIGVTFQQVQKYEWGANALPSSRVCALCEALQTEPNELFGFES